MVDTQEDSERELLPITLLPGYNERKPSLDSIRQCDIY